MHTMVRCCTFDKVLGQLARAFVLRQMSIKQETRDARWVWFQWDDVLDDPPCPLKSQSGILKSWLSNKFIIVFYSANVRYSSLTSVHIKWQNTQNEPNSIVCHNVWKHDKNVVCLNNLKCPLEHKIILKTKRTWVTLLPCFSIHLKTANWERKEEIY